tara:strand:- start:45 stop:320 length:276 start_codon:yes stop_codon:yes gene_type:complete
MNITKTEEELEFYAPAILISSGVILLCYFCRVWKKKALNIQMLNPLLKNDKLQKKEKLEKIEEIEEQEEKEENVILAEEELPSYGELYNKK